MTASTATLRSSTKVWLVGSADKDILGSGLPTNGAIMRNFMFHHCQKGLTVARSANATIRAALEIWQKARLPTQRVDSGVRKLLKLHNEYCALKKHRFEQNERYRFKEELFTADLNELFDLSRKDAADVVVNEEDRVFLAMQQEDPSSSSMAGIDKTLMNIEARKRKRVAQAVARKEKCAASNAVQRSAVLASNFDEIEHLYSGASDSDDDFEAPVSSSSRPPRKTTKKVVTVDVASALDRVKLPDRGAMFVVGAVAQALGVQLDEVALSRSTIKRARMATRKEVATSQQAGFTTDTPLLLHWDGKLLPDIAGSKELVDRIAILVTGSMAEQLLGVPKVLNGTGMQQCNACLRALDDWQIRENVQGLVFDTTSSNTGLKIGACTLIEKALGREIVWIACRHHVFEVVLSSVFCVALGPTGGPESGLFKRFKKSWQSIDKTMFQPASDNDFVDMPDGLRQEMKSFYRNAMESQGPREDYRELLQLCFIFLGGSSCEPVSFRCPGAMHNARWMAKAIYSLKMFLFRGQFRLTAHEKTALTNISFFVALIYARYWHEAPLADRAPFNDLQFLNAVHQYPVHYIRTAAVEAFGRHLWYLSEYLAPLALFDERVNKETKVAMVSNFSLPPKKAVLKRLNPKTFNHLDPLESYITRRSLKLFDLLSSKGQEEAKLFLAKTPDLWEMDPIYQEMKAKVKLLKVVNDCAERGVALIQSYNSALTKNESQKQYMLQLVSRHRKLFPTPTKAALKLK